MWTFCHHFCKSAHDVVINDCTSPGSASGWISPPAAQDCQVCRQETQGRGVPQHQAVPIFGWGGGKCGHEEKAGAAGMSWGCAGDRVKAEWLIVTVGNVCDRTKAGQQLENKQIHNLRKYNFPGYRAKFFQAPIPFACMRGENTSSHWKCGISTAELQFCALKHMAHVPLTPPGTVPRVLS